MPTPRAEETQLAALRHHLAQHTGLTHLRARRYGATLLVESGREAPPIRHLRFRRDTIHLWRLDIANHRGQWEATDERGTLAQLVTRVVTAYPWTVAEIE